VTSTAHRTQFIRVLFSPPVIYHNLQVTSLYIFSLHMLFNKLTPSLSAKDYCFIFTP